MLHFGVQCKNNQDLSKIKQFWYNIQLIRASIADLEKQGVIDGFIFHNRDKNFKKNIEIYNPDLVILGKLHVTWLKRKFPDAKYAFI